MLCLLLTLVFQNNQEKHELQGTLNNLHHNYSTMQNESYLKEEMLTNKSIECEYYKNYLDTLNREQNRCHGETKITPNFSQHSGTEGIF